MELLAKSTPMTEVYHTITEDDQFRTAGDASVAIQQVHNDGALDVMLMPFDGGDTEEWEWSEERVVELLVEGSLIPQEGDAVDFLVAE